MPRGRVGERRYSGQFHARHFAPREKIPWYPLDRRLGGSKSRSGQGGKRKLLPLPEI
jgi:hypothetical protein